MEMALVPLGGGSEGWPGVADAFKVNDMKPFSAMPTSAAGLDRPGTMPSVTSKPSSSTKSSRTLRACSSFTICSAPRSPVTSSSWPNAKYTVCRG